jgi:anti-sigma factor RsiW
MTHEEYEALLSAYVDDEIDAPDALTALEAHLATCASCTARLAQYRELRVAVGDTLRRQAVAERAPEALRERVAAALRAADATAESPWVAKRRARPWRLGAGGVLAAAAAIVIAVAIGTRGGGDDAVSREVLDSHIRSLAGDEAHLMDVASTDQHTVKPWYAGKLDFAPTVVDFGPQGFPLLGGRVDYVAGHRAAALVYGRRQHKINLYEWPASDAKKETNLASELRLGYSVLHWTHAGMVYWAVSDVNPADLEQLARNIDSTLR